MRIFLADVPEPIEIPVELQARMMAPLHQNLHAAHRAQFVQFLVQLLATEDVVVLIFFGAIKCAELAVNIADVRVIDVAIDDVGHDLFAAAVVGRALRLSSPCVSQGPEFFQRPAIKLQRFVAGDAFAGEDLLG